MNKPSCPPHGDGLVPGSESGSGVCVYIGELLWPYDVQHNGGGNFYRSFQSDSLLFAVCEYACYQCLKNLKF